MKVLIIYDAAKYNGFYKKTNKQNKIFINAAILDEINSLKNKFYLSIIFIIEMFNSSQSLRIKQCVEDLL